MKGIIVKRNGAEYPNLTHEMIYALLCLSAFLQRASLVERNMAHNNERGNHSMVKILTLNKIAYFWMGTIQ
jgi:hypothetical protein